VTTELFRQLEAKVGKNVYYMTLDNWYLSQYINIKSNDIDMIISNLQTLAMKVEKWKNDSLQVAIRQETVQTPYGLVFFTYDKQVAENIFTNGYLISEKEDLFKNLSVDSASDPSLMDVKLSLPNTDTEELQDSLSDAFMEIYGEGDSGEGDSKESLQVEVQDHLPEELFDDLEEIGLSTVDGEVKPEDDEDPLPEDLFFDLADSAKSTVELNARSEDEEVK